jgi:hypothetical protein
VKNWFQTARFATLSLACVVLSLLSFGAFVISGMNHRLGSSMDKVGRFAVLGPCLIAIVLALASVIWNPRKTPGIIVLLVAVIAAGLLYSFGG